MTLAGTQSLPERNIVRKKTQWSFYSNLRRGMWSMLGAYLKTWIICFP